MENYTYTLSSSYPDSNNSSPHSREIEYENPPPWEDNSQNYRVKFMCSYGGKIQPRPHDNLLTYIGGETKILAVDRNIKFSALISRLVGLCEGDNSISFKYQLPGEDLDSLITVTNDEDLEHMMHEYDRLFKASPKPARLRIFIFSGGLSQNPSLSSFGSEDGKSDKERFVEALNSSAPVFTAPAVVAESPLPAMDNVDFLFGLEKVNAQQQQVIVEDPVVVPGIDDPIQKHIQDLQRLRIEEQQQQAINYPPRNYENLDNNRVADRSSPVTVANGMPYWTEKQQQSAGVYPVSTMNNDQQQIYMIPSQHHANAYHAPMMRQMAGSPAQGYYAVQRYPPPDMYRDQMYNLMPPSTLKSMAAPPPSLPPQRVAGYSDGYGMMRPVNQGGVVVTESGYAQVAYDGGMGRQVIYNTPGGMMSMPAPLQASTPAVASVQYQQPMVADLRQGGVFNPETGSKVVPIVTTQPSV